MTVMSPSRRVWTLLCAILIMVIIAVLARLFLPISTPPFRDVAGAPVPNSVAVAERWDIDGLEQSVVIRARDSSKPVLVWAGDFVRDAAAASFQLRAGRLFFGGVLVPPLFRAIY
jgi:hypothetical protein